MCVHPTIVDWKLVSRDIYSYTHVSIDVEQVAFNMLCFPCKAFEGD